jgi:hypothetical protein
LYAESSIMFPSTSSVGVFRHSMFLPLLIPVYSVCMWRWFLGEIWIH